MQRTWDNPEILLMSTRRMLEMLTTYEAASKRLVVDAAQERKDEQEAEEEDPVQSWMTYKQARIRSPAYGTYVCTQIAEAWAISMWWTLVNRSHY